MFGATVVVFLRVLRVYCTLHQRNTKTFPIVCQCSVILMRLVSAFNSYLDVLKNFIVIVTTVVIDIIIHSSMIL